MKMSYSDERIQQVWEKGKITGGNSPDSWRKDECTAWIKREGYDNRDSKYGWEVDHIDPNGSDELSNLRPLQWENNVDKSDGRLKCNITSCRKDNIRQ